MLVDRVPRRRIALLSGISGVLTVLSAATALFDSSVYEEALPPVMLIGTLGFDAMTLLAAGLMLTTLVAVERGADRYWLVWFGLQGYLLYAYSLYAFGLVFTPLYLVYLAIMGLSAYALAGFALSFDAAVLKDWSPPRLPRRTMGVTLAFIALVFAVLWVATMLGFLGGPMPDAAAIVLVLDVAFTLPLMIVAGVLLYRARPLGDLLAPGIFAMSASIALGVAAGEFIRPALGEDFSFAIAAPYLVPGSICAAFSIFALRRVGARIPPTVQPAGGPHAGPQEA